MPMRFVPVLAILLATPALAQPALPPPELSTWAMVSHADLVVKAVLAGLFLASVLCWTVALAKAWELRGAHARARQALALLAKAPTLEEARHSLAALGGPCAALAAAAAQEVARSPEGADRAGIKERTFWQLERIVAGAGRSMARGTGLLATIGATAPFVGLFGTVWGIMHSFVGIARSQTTNLAVVAPGIAEALLATAIGLVAAIPAVVIYNACARAITGHKAQLADAAAETMRLLSRDLDRGQAVRLRVVGG